MSFDTNKNTNIFDGCKRTQAAIGKRGSLDITGFSD
jgi:hypothetical protein